MDNLSHRPNTRESIERFEKMYFQTRTLLFHYIRKFVTTGPDDVEDVLQECYVRLWENMDKIMDDENIVPLLRTYAINYSINQLKKYAKEQQRAAIYQNQQASTTDTWNDLQLKYTLSEFNEAIEALPPQRKLVYRLIREQGLSHQQISARLGISTKTIERHITEAMRTLRNQFTQEKLLLLIILMRLRG